ncbi:MAG: SgcJ/EcaC family oxidoreductase [Methylobacteriaceae bacterium]|nr:SgcJ/EcaC family oxidoreductase [Methylobacteriaceae bacterium]
MKLGLAVLLILAAVSVASADTNMTCKATSEADIKGLFDRWNNSLKTGNPDEVVKNYASDAILLPTVSNKPRLTQDERRDYFVHFLENKPVGEINMRVIKLGCNDAIDAGIYTFSFGDGPNKGKQVRARYTYTYTLNDGKWLISSHHSSAMPEKSD